MTRRAWVIAVVVAVVAGGILSTFWVKDVLRVRRENRYNYTWLGLKSLGRALQRYLERNGHLPGPTFADVSREMSDLSYWDCDDGNLGEFEATVVGGCDMWGRPLRYELLTPSEATVTSLGDNGRDDQGKGDDMVLHVNRFSVTVLFKFGK